MKYYIKQRNNPQFEKPYYSAEGKLSKKDAKKKEATAYGENIMLAYDNEDQYKAALKKLLSGGFQINNNPYQTD